jgi:hypothetical protein
MNSSQLRNAQQAIELCWDIEGNILPELTLMEDRRVHCIGALRFLAQLLHFLDSLNLAITSPQAPQIMFPPYVGVTDLQRFCRNFPVLPNMFLMTLMV